MGYNNGSGEIWIMSNYWECMKLEPSRKDCEKERCDPKNTCSVENPAKGTESDRRFEAYKKAHEIRQFEIGLFWQRATYYWAFILAAFTAHFALVGLLFSGEKDFSIPELYNLPGLSLFALSITSFFCYFFSQCWVLMNKGSKFWQKNWEEHIDELGQEFSGDLYKTILNTNSKECFSSCIFSLKAYDYSVSKITMLTALSLMVVSLLMFLFYIAMLLCRFSRFLIGANQIEKIRWVIGIIILIVIFLLSFLVRKNSLGNDVCEYSQKSSWRNTKI